MAKITTAQLVKIISGLGMLSFLSMGAIANAQVTVFEGLPPYPPSIPTLRDTPKDEDIEVDDIEVDDFEFEFDDLEAVPIEQPPSLSLTEFNFEAPTVQPRALQNAYRVEVRSNNRQDLELVRRVEPEAFMRGDRIQAGVFSDRNNARALQSDLRDEGLNAKIVDVDSNAVAAIGSSGDNNDSAAYFVAIPVRGSAVDLQNRVLATGVNASLVQTRESVRGDYVAIGPFYNRAKANAVNSQVRAVSLDGRLYFRR